MSRHDFGLLSPSKAGHGLPRVSSAPALTAVDALPCDDERLEAADHFSRVSLQTSSSAHNLGRPGTGLSAPSLSRPGTGWSVSALSAGVRPASGWSSSTWEVKSSTRPGTCVSSSLESPSKKNSGRFNSEELVCFKRLHYPSHQCANKADVYFQTTGEVKRALADANWHMMPASKGKFYSNAPLLLDSFSNNNQLSSTRRTQSPVQDHLLPDEALTATVLDEIYPRTPRKREEPKIIQEESDAGTSPDKMSMTMSPASIFGASEVDRNRFGSSWESVDSPPPKKTSKQTRFKGSVLSSLDCMQGTPSTPQEPRTPLQRTTRILTAPVTQPVPGSKGEFGGMGLGAGANLPLTPLVAMMDFRKILIDRYDSMDEAIKLLRSELADGARMSKKEFRRALQKHALNLSKEERDAVFTFLDINGDGYVSILEFDLASQAASPVKSLADLRRRWLAANVPSLSHAVRSMKDLGGSSIGTRLSLREFGEKLCYLHVMDPGEHVDLFNILIDPGDSHSRVAMAELVAGLATVSPPMLLEDLRNTLQRRYAGNFERAFSELDTERLGCLKRGEFVDRIMARFGLTELEASKLYREIDVDESGRVTRGEFLSALALSEPSLFLEDLRRKVLQRWRSIRGAFHRPFDENNPAREAEKSPALCLEKFQEILLAVELTEEETARLFRLIDIDGSDSLTVAEFVKGTLQFAPSWALEDLRLQCMCCQKVAARVFDDVEISRTAALDFSFFSEILNDLGLAAGVNVHAIFDILDVMHTGYVTLGQLIAALQSGGIGNTIKLSEDECHSWAKQDARGCILSAHKLLGDLKVQVRQGVDEDIDNASLEPSQNAIMEAAPSKTGALRKGLTRKVMSLLGRKAGQKLGCQAEGSDGASSSRGSSPAKPKDGGARKSTADSLNASGKGKVKKSEKKVVSGHRAPFTGDDDCDDDSDLPKAKCATVLSKLAPRLRTLPRDDVKDYVTYQATSPEAGPQRLRNLHNPHEDVSRPSQNVMNDNQKSLSHVWDRLNHASGAKDRQGLQKEIHNYFETVSNSLAHDVPLLEKAHSRHAIYTEARKHATLLQKPAKAPVKSQSSELIIP